MVRERRRLSWEVVIIILAILTIACVLWSAYQRGEALFSPQLSSQNKFSSLQESYIQPVYGNENCFSNCNHNFNECVNNSTRPSQVVACGEKLTCCVEFCQGRRQGLC